MIPPLKCSGDSHKKQVYALIVGSRINTNEGGKLSQLLKQAKPGVGRSLSRSLPIPSSGTDNLRLSASDAARAVGLSANGSIDYGSASPPIVKPS